MTIQSYCIGHTPPLFLPTCNYKFLGSAPLGLNNEIVIPDNRFGPNIDGGTLAEYSQLFGLAKMLETGDIAADFLHLFQYRKFLSNKHIHNQNAWMYSIPGNVAHLAFPDLQEENLEQNSLIVGHEFNLSENIATSYSQAHVPEDLIYFTLACKESGHFSNEEAETFSESKRIIFSPALCIIETGLFVKLMLQMLNIWLVFSKTFYRQRDGYQRRVAGYLFERYHSHKIYELSACGKIENLSQWNRFLVTPPKKRINIDGKQNSTHI